MITNKNVETKEFVSKFIEPGITEAKISKIESIKASTGTYGLKIYFETAPVEGLNGAGRTAEERMYLSEKATPITIGRLRRIADAIGVRAQFDEFQAEEATYGNAISSLFVNKPARYLFQGQEVAGKNGKPNWYKAELYNGFSFVEPLSVSPTKLVFNPSVHLKPLETVNVNAGPVVNKKAVEGLY